MFKNLKFKSNANSTVLKLAACALSMSMIFSACSQGGESLGGQSSGSSAGTQASSGAADGQNKISVISRENGSGTRSAFTELTGLVVENSEGKKEDLTTTSAQIINSTGTVIATVEGNKATIGYISLGSLGDNVKALAIDGVEPTAENVSSGNYKISRKFNIVTKQVIDAKNKELVEDFTKFILSEAGQKVITDFGAVSVGAGEKFTSTGVSGTIKVGGSSSVKPVMEKLREEYIKLNPNATVEVSQSDSTTGVNSTVDGTIDIGMVSRDVKQAELDKGLVATSIAVDGIVVIVNKENTVSSITSEQVKKIFSGEITSWEELSGV